MDTTPTFSIVIPCLNEERYIGSLLDDIAKQTLQPKEVIVADSRSQDRTIKVAKGFQRNLPLKIATSRIRSPGAARNTGAKLATADYIIFIDADMRLPATAFEQTLNATNGGQVDYVTPVFSTPGHHPIDQLAIIIINFDIRFAIRPKPNLPGIGGYMCVRRSLHETLNGFKTNVRSEDIEYLIRLKRRNATYAVLKNLVIETSNRRLVQDGRFVSALNFIPQRWWLSRYIINPALKKLGREKKFGNYPE